MGHSGLRISHQCQRFENLKCNITKLFLRATCVSRHKMEVLVWAGDITSHLLSSGDINDGAAGHEPSVSLATDKNWEKLFFFYQNSF